MDGLVAALEAASDFVWGPVMIVLLLGTGLYLSIGLKFLPQRKLLYGFKLMFAGRKATREAGDITPFQALTTALSATVGTGNIAGVATAIFLGGPGAVLWMWVTAIVGMATKYSEGVLAVRFREVDERGAYVGGPMYYIRNGLGPKAHWLGLAFALFASVAALGAGNTVQSNSVALLFESSMAIPRWVTGIVLSVAVFAVIIGGIRRIGRVAEYLVPFMAVVYVVGGIVVLLFNAPQVPGAFALIVEDAFTGTAAAGGFAGAGVMAAIRFGVARGIFSNEAGLGSAAIAHAAARTNDPVRQGSIAMLGTFLDTIVVCTVTALVIITTGAWTGGENGAELSMAAFGKGLPMYGEWIVTFGLAVFAFSTVLAWSYYGERCAEYIFGVRIILPYRWFWVLILFVGAIGDLGVIWMVADILNALMAVPNLIALLLLSPVVFQASHQYFVLGQPVAAGGKPSGG